MSVCIIIINEINDCCLLFIAEIWQTIIYRRKEDGLLWVLYRENI